MMHVIDPFADASPFWLGLETAGFFVYGPPRPGTRQLTAR